ncbi:hypothetical protein HU200_007516 [Digitaria exilis]|uniref:BTB domain-containing protein n=1 Tax=Digitaria exilis TaxID=1010633 RepID=A0A835FPE0_9POAL|nr:hypothetical protein HU200_007516 [Digitaria exilis]
MLGRLGPARRLSFPPNPKQKAAEPSTLHLPDPAPPPCGRPKSAAGGARFLSSASAIGELPTGKSIMSHPFRAGDSSWRIKYYPNGFRSEYADSISIFLALNESVPVPGSIKFMNLREYSGARREFGIAKFIDRHEDRRAHAPFVVVPPSDLNQHLGNLFVAEDVAGRTFKAHRFLLAARSPVFKAELLGGMKESRAIADHIQIDDILPQVFETLLHFVYNDSLPEMEGEEEAMMAQHLLEAAEQVRYAEAQADL